MRAPASDSSPPNANSSPRLLCLLSPRLSPRRPPSRPTSIRAASVLPPPAPPPRPPSLRPRRLPPSAPRRSTAVASLRPRRLGPPFVRAASVLPLSAPPWSVRAASVLPPSVPPRSVRAASVCRLRQRRLLASTAAVRLATEFRTADDDEVRARIVRSLLPERATKCARAAEPDQILRRVATVYDTAGSTRARALALRMFGCLAELAKDSVHVRSLILSGLSSSNAAEVIQRSTLTYKVSCSRGHFCRLGSTTEEKCIIKGSCKANTENENIIMLGASLVGALVVLLLIIYNCSGQFLTIRERRKARSRENAIQLARQQLKAHEGWKAAKQLARRHVNGVQGHLSRTFSRRRSFLQQPDPEISSI